MVDRTWKRLQAMLVKMANEDPNALIQYLYSSGMDNEDMQDLEYLVTIARRARGYNEDADMLRIHNIM